MSDKIIPNTDRIQDSPSMARTMARGASLVTSGNIVGTVISMITAMAVSYILIPSELGSATIVFSFAALFQLGSDLGISVSVIKFSREKSSNKEERDKTIKSYVAAKLTMGSIWGTLSFVSAILLWTITTPSKNNSLLLLTAIVVIGSVFALLSKSVLYSLQSFGFVPVSEITRKMFILVILVLLGPHFQAYAYVLGTAGSGFVAVAVTTGYILKKHFFTSKEVLTISEILSRTKEFVRFGIPISFSAFFKYIYTNYSILLLAIFLTSEEIGYYNFSQTIAGLVLIISVSIADVLLPILSEINVNQNREKFVLALQQSNRLVLAMSIPFALILSVSGPLLLSVLLSRTYANSAPILWGFAIQTAIYPIFYNLNMTIIASGNTKLDMIKSGSMLSSNLLFSTILTPIFGGTGAAFSMSLTFLVGLIVGIRLLNKRLDVYKLYPHFFLKPFISTVPSICIILFFSPLITSPWTLIAVLAFAGLSYLIACAIFGVITYSDIQLAEELISYSRGLSRLVIPLLHLYAKIIPKKRQ